MKNKKINLNKIKVAIFDFDDTLAIHKDRDFIKHRNENEENLVNYFLNAYLYPDTFYDSIEPCFILDSLKEIVKTCEIKGIKMYCVSGMRFSLHLNAKKHFINKHYSEKIELISTRSQEAKCDAIKIIQRINKCELNEILFVDDKKENIISFNNMGVHGIFPEDAHKLIYEE